MQVRARKRWEALNLRAAARDRRARARVCLDGVVEVVDDGAEVWRDDRMSLPQRRAGGVVKAYVDLDVLEEGEVLHDTGDSTIERTFASIGRTLARTERWAPSRQFVSRGCGTMSTGQMERWTTRSATLPSTRCVMPVRPWVPTTTRSALVFLACWTISAGGNPCRLFV